MAYRFRFYDFRGWYELGFLPLRNCTVTWRAGEIGRLDASLPLNLGTVPVRPGGEQAIFVERDGMPLWAGPVWAVDWSSDTAYATIRASDWGSLLRRRRVREDLGFTQVDQLDIARGLIDASQRAHGGLGHTHIDTLARRPQAGRQLSGVLRDRTYLALDRKEVWEALQQLSQVQDGFELRLVPHYVARVPELWLEFTYPPRSERSGLVLEYRTGWPGSSVVGYRWSWDGSETVNVAEAANDEEVATAHDPRRWARYPVLEALVQRGGEHGVQRIETLREHAQQLLEEQGLPRSAASLTLRAGLEGVGPELVGQLVRTRLTSWRHPPGPHGEPGFDQELEIEEMQLSLPSDERPETLTLQVASRLWQAPRELEAEVDPELVGSRAG